VFDDVLGDDVLQEVMTYTNWRWGLGCLNAPSLQHLAHAGYRAEHVSDLDTMQIRNLVEADLGPSEILGADRGITFHSKENYFQFHTSQEGVVRSSGGRPA